MYIAPLYECPYLPLNHDHTGDGKVQEAEALGQAKASVVMRNANYIWRAFSLHYKTICKKEFNSFYVVIVLTVLSLQNYLKKNCIHFMSTLC